MTRPCKNINFCEIFQNVNKDLSIVLKKCKNGTAVDLLEADEVEELKDCLFTLIKINYVECMSAENILILKHCLELFLCIICSNISIEMKLGFTDIMRLINNDELCMNELGIANVISKVNEYWLTKIKSPEEIKGLEYFTLQHLLNLCSSEKPLVSDIQRLSAIRKFISAVPFDKAVPSLKPVLIKIVQNVQVLSSEHGQRFISQALVLSHKIMMEIHKTITLDLSSCNKKKATNYGKIYILAWHAASEDMKKVLEKTCFQNLMELMLKEQRVSLDLNKSSQNILVVLEVWHSERKKKNPDFITMITNAYQPILWKYLQSGFNVHRCNATDVFFKAFPLQRSGDNAVDAEILFNKQFDVMLASLTDDCHIIRIIGIREVCNILSLYWNSFSPLQIQSLMSVITKQNANDASSAEVRRMVYLGFQNLIKSPLSREYVKQILPNLANNIHDINQKVRIAFFQLLISIKELKDPNFKYSDCVSMFNIQYRLAEDNIAVGQWIVKLLMRNYYHSKMSVMEWTKRFIYLIKTYRNSYRNFFFYSGKSLPFTDACKIIYEILTQIGTFVLSKFGVEENENLDLKSADKSINSKKLPLSELNRNQNSPAEGSNSFKKCAFDDPDVVVGLFDIVTILWILNDIKLSKPENEDIRFKLYDVYIKYAQPFINYYKDCNLFLAVITLSGNIPASLLRNNSITLPGYCVKMLKSIKVDRSNEENEKIVSMLIALVKWGRGNEILEQVALWLDAAFETKDMNETILPRRRVKINEDIQPDSVVAINILDTLLKKEYVKLSILKKNYYELFSLWKFMSRIRSSFLELRNSVDMLTIWKQYYSNNITTITIKNTLADVLLSPQAVKVSVQSVRILPTTKKLIETRLEQGEPFEEDLVSDEFLSRCFQRYVKLIPLLKEEEKSEEGKENQNQSSDSNSAKDVFINRQKEMENVIEWGENFLFPLLQGENLEEADANLITATLEDILYVSDNMIIVHMVNNMFHFKIAHFVLKLLSTRYGIYFIKAASRITVALSFSAKLLFKVSDDLQIFSTVIPSLLSHTLDILTVQYFTSKQIEKIDKDMPIIKTCFGKILASYQDNLNTTSSLKENVRQLKLVVSFFVDCIISIVSQKVPGENLIIPIYSNPSHLPPIAGSLFSLFHNKKTWTSLFMHIIGTKLSGKNVSAKTTICYILLLNLYAISDKKLSETDLKKVLASANQNLIKLRESMGNADGQAEEVFSQSDTETATKKTWLSNAATRGYSGFCSELNSKPDDIGNVSKDCSLITKHVDENISNDKKFEMIHSFQCEENNLEMDFITCGFELIKNIETKIKEKFEAEDST